MSSTTTSLQPKLGAKRQYFGVLFDDYTPAVEGQLLRDCLALQNVAEGKNRELVIVCESDKPDALLKSLSIRRVPTPALTKYWIMYRTKEDWMEEPADAKQVITRDLFVDVKKPKMTVVDEKHSNGYYLPPQGRLSPDTISLLRPAPNGYVFTDPWLSLVFS